MRCRQFFSVFTLYFTQEQEENKTALFGLSAKWLYPHYPAGQSFFPVTLREERQRERAERWLILL
jgi:hypothetical protein